MFLRMSNRSESVTPTAKGLSKSATEKPADYGYSVELLMTRVRKLKVISKKMLS